MTIIESIVSGDLCAAIQKSKDYKHSINEKTKMTPLMYACKRKSMLELSKILIEKDNNPFETDYKKRTLLDLTPYTCPEFIEILIRKGIPYNKNKADQNKKRVISQIKQKLLQERYKTKEYLLDLFKTL